MNTVAQLIDRYLTARAEIRGTQRGSLARIAKDKAICTKDARNLTAKEIIGWLAQRGVSASTANADLTYLRGCLDYAEIGLGIEGVSSIAIQKALPLLRRHRLIGSSLKRNRVPTPEEHAAILAQVRSNPRELLAAEVIEYQYESARRIGESCRHMWGDLDTEKKTILVRDMKHPRMKSGHNVRVAIPDPAFAIIMRQPRLTTRPDERIFKIPAKTVSAVYRRAVNALGIKDLHLHDNRRGCVTRLLAEKTVQQVMLVTAHLSPTMPLTIYNGLQAEDFHKVAA